MRQFFSTRSNGGGRTVSGAWDQIINSTYRGLHLGQTCEDFEAQLVKWQIGDCTLSWPRSKGMVVERWQQESGRSHRTVVMHLQHRGSARLIHRGRAEDLGPGDLMFCAGDEYSRLEANQKHEVLVAEFKLDNIISLVPDIDNRLARKHSASQPFIGALHSMILALWRDGIAEVSHQSQGVLENALCSMAAVSLLESSGITKDPSSSIRARLSNAIAARFHDPELTINELAQDMGVTARTIQLAVAQMGSTPQMLLRDYRLERAMEMLRLHPKRSVTAIAFDVGFNDSGYFARCFRQKYGVTPRSINAVNADIKLGKLF